MRFLNVEILFKKIAFVLVLIYLVNILTPSLSIAQESPPPQILEELKEVNITRQEPSESRVAILVDENTLSDSGMASLVYTYANTVSKELEKSQSVVIPIKRQEKPFKIAALLEQLYREEGLVGTVLIGEIPTPILEKEGESFPSIFPYIDFDNKLWVYDEKPGVEKYIENKFSISGYPEIWSGVIKPNVDPISGTYNSQLKDYLTKVINFHNGTNPAEKKIAYMDYLNKAKSAPPSATERDYVDQTINTILSMGRYDLNYHSLYRDNVNKLEKCAAGLIPATIKVIKTMAKIRPWKPETLKYLLLPLIYIPPIPGAKSPTPEIGMPSVPDMSSVLKLASKLKNVDKLPNPSLVTNLKDLAPKIADLKDIDPTSITKLIDSIPTNLPDPSKIQQIQQLLSAQSSASKLLNTAHAGSKSNAGDLGSSLESLDLPSSDDFSHVISELESNKQGDPNAPKQNLDYVKSQDSNVNVNEASQSLQSLNSQKDTINVPETGKYNLDFLDSGSSDLKSLSTDLASITTNLQIPSVDAKFRVNKDSAKTISDQLSNLDTPELPDLGAEIGGALKVFDSFSGLPLLPSIPKIGGIDFNIEIPPPMMPIFLPGLPSPLPIDPMNDFYVIPLDLIMTPPPIPPTSITNNLKSMLKIPEIPALPKFPEIPSFDGVIGSLDYLEKLPDLKPLEDTVNSKFMQEVKNNDLTGLKDLSSLANKPSSNHNLLASTSRYFTQMPSGSALDSLKKIDTADFDGLINSLQDSKNYITQIADFSADTTKLVSTIKSKDLSYINSSFDASKLNPETLSELRANISALHYTKQVSDFLGSSDTKSTISDISGTEEEINQNTDDLASKKEGFGVISELSEPLTTLKSNITALQSFNDAIPQLTPLDETINKIKEIASFGDEINKFKDAFDNAKPANFDKNIENLNNLSSLPEPDLMSLLNISISTYTLPSFPKFPKIAKANKMSDIRGNTGKTILNQDIWKGLLGPTKDSWELLCKAEGATFDDLNDFIRRSSFYNKIDVLEIDREPKNYDKSYMEKYMDGLIANLGPGNLGSGVVPGNVEMAIINANGTADELDLGGAKVSSQSMPASFYNVGLIYGGPFGDYTKPNYIGGSMIFKGNAISTIANTARNQGSNTTPIDLGATDQLGYGVLSDDIFMSTFAEGKISLGEALKPSWTESQVLLGDPTVSLSAQGKNNDNDYSITVGQTINQFNKGDVLLVSGDINSDSRPDVLTVNQTNGEIQWFRGEFDNVRTKFFDEGILYVHDLQKPDLKKIETEVPEDISNLDDVSQQKVLEKMNNLLKALIEKVEFSDQNGDGKLDVVIHEKVPGDPPPTKITILTNDGLGNLKFDKTLTYKSSGTVSSSDGRMPENVIAYQFGENNFIPETRFKTVQGDFDKDSDTDFIYSTGKQLQYKENLKNGRRSISTITKPYILRKFENLDGVKKPIDLKEALPNEGYAEVSFYSSYLNDLQGYNIYYGESRYKFTKKQVIPVTILSDTINPTYKLFGLDNYKRTYFYITAFNSNGEETPISEIGFTTPRIEKDTQNPRAAITSPNEILVNSLYDYSGSESSDNSKHISYKWDFDLMTDSDGDGITSNDVDSTEKNPSHFYTSIGNYEISLETKDLNNNISSTTNKIKVILPKDLILVYENDLVLFVNELSPNLEVTYYKINKKEKYDDPEVIEELITKYTDANGYVSYEPITNVAGSRLVDDKSGAVLAFFNNNNKIFASKMPYEITTSFKQTQIEMFDEGKKSLALIYFVTDRNEDSKIVDSVVDVISSGSLNTGVYAEDADINDKFKLGLGENGSVRMIDTEDQTEKTYATILPSGGMYLDNDAYLTLDQNEEREFVFEIRLKGFDNPLAKILIKPTNDSKVKETSKANEDEPGIYLMPKSGTEDVEASDLDLGDQIFAIVRDSLKNESPRTNIVKVRKYHSSTELPDIATGKVLGASTSRNQQIVSIDNSGTYDYLSDTTPTFHGRVAIFDSQINLSIIDQNTQEEVFGKTVDTSKTGYYDLLVTKKLKEGDYLLKVKNLDDKILEIKPLHFDITPPETPKLSYFDGKTISGVTEPYAEVEIQNFDSIFNPLVLSYADETGYFETSLETKTASFEIKAKDLSGNISEAKEYKYNENSLLDQSFNRFIAFNQTSLLDQEQLNKEQKTEVFWGVFILIIGISAYIYSIREKLFPDK